MKTLRSLFGHTPNKTPAVIALPDRSGEDALVDRANPSPRTNGEDDPAQDNGAKRRITLPNVTLPTLPIRKRVAVLLAAIAVPAMAAPGDFGALPGAAPTEAELVNARLSQQLAENPAMPFEKPGMSFPGSAFFFLADPPSGALVALPTVDATDPGAEAGRELGELIDAGPSAQPFFSAGGVSHMRASECLAQAIWYEAASESEAGQRAVAQVVLNRVAHRSWPGSVCGVVYEGSQRSTGCQFSFTCDGSLARRATGSAWASAQRIAGEALSGSVYEPIGHATHYHTLWVNPYWASSLDHVGTIGAHRFYRNRGAAGEASAFAGRYAGFEPGVSGRMMPVSTGAGTRIGLPDLPGANTGSSGSVSSTNPSTQYGSGPADGAVSSNAPEPILADPALSGVGQVREDYARAGQWKSDAAREALQAEERALAVENAGGNANGTSPDDADASPPPQSDEPTP
ncbi:cell wall hydrolase [Erythrobacter sp. Alg231-14]|uniref:cell wall hydrolase n=1 Tax=Erythrobacter sp. Alg231-14 TaxID=1922225 RepID=UPI00307BF22A